MKNSTNSSIRSASENEEGRNVEGKEQGVTDTPLTDKGREQAREQSLDDEDLDNVAGGAVFWLPK